jgi:hypothetical protein
MEAARDYLTAAETVVRVVTDITLPELDDTLPSSPADPERLVTLADQWNLGSPVNRLLVALQGS